MLISENKVTVFGSLCSLCKDLKKYLSYFLYYVKALEKSRVSNTVLGYIWWFLDPFLNMVIYTVLVRVVFNHREENYPIFFFSAMLVWRYFSMVVAQSAESIKSNIGICQDNYVPKIVFPLSLCFTGLTPLLFSLLLLWLMAFMVGIPMTINILYVPLLVCVLIFFTLVCAIISAHINMFVSDFSSILPHILTMGMFVTPIFYDSTQVPEKYCWLVALNPLSFFTDSFRNIFTYGIGIDLKRMLLVLLGTSVFFVYSIYILYTYDKVYNKLGIR